MMRSEHEHRREKAEIRRLPPEVVAKIAAGEVILRPVSVARELLENSLDAGARQVGISVGDSPDQLLEVTDDGIGMSRDGLLLSIEPHATSKLRGEEDLLAVNTLGFRGEALPSIARVSRIEIITAQEGELQGWELKVEGGRPHPVEPAARPRGTTVRVQDLFFNSPVRKRFLKTPEGEMRLIVRMVTTYALAFPGVGFRLVQRGAAVLELPPAEDSAARIVQVYGPSFREKILTLESSDSAGEIGGHVGIPELARPGTQHQTMIVNQRWVNAPWFSAALRQGFGDLIPPNRHPFALVFLTIDPARVDVNVHPTKREVRFLDESPLFGSLVRAVQAQTRQLVPGWNLDPGDPGSGMKWEKGAQSSWRRGQDATGGGRPGPAALDLFYRPGSDVDLVRETDAASGNHIGDAAALPEAETAPDQPTGGPQGGVRTAPSDAAPAGLVPLWQLHQKYVLAQTRQGFMIIDQHAAHERVLYEQALRNLQGSMAATQQLLFPLSLELDSDEWESWGKICEDLINLGIDAEEFGRQTVLLRGAPGLWNSDPEGRFRELLEQMGSRRTHGRDRLQHLAASFACRTAVRAGQSLSLEEMNRLVDQLFATSLPHGDPHGRPTFLQVTLEDLDRRFGR